MLYYKYCNKHIFFANHADLSFSLPNNDSKRSVQVSNASSVVCLHKFVHVSICLHSPALLWVETSEDTLFSPIKLPMNNILG